MSQSLLAGVASVGAGGEKTYVEDVFSTYLYTGNGGTQVIENSIHLSDTNAGGSGYFDGAGARLVTESSTDFAMGTGDFTIECFVNTSYASSASLYVGIISLYKDGTDVGPIMEFYNNNWAMYNGASHSYFTSVTLNTWHHVAITRESGTQKMWVNGTLLGTASAPTNFTASVPCIIGGLTDSNTYPTTGYISNVRVVKGTALYTTGFTPPTSALTAVSGTVLLTCQGDEPFVDNSSNSFDITNTGNALAKKFGPFTSDVASDGGMVWIKARSGTESTAYHGLWDTERGDGKYIGTNTTGAEVGNSGDLLQSFNNDGFQVNTTLLGSFNETTNAASTNYASWTFRKAPKFFDVVTYTGDGTNNRAIPHNLEVIPGFILIKRTDGAGNWRVWHRSVAGGLILNNQDPASTSYWGSSDQPTSTDFLVSSYYTSNESGQTYVAYLFAHDAGGFGDSGEENVISCGSFTGNGSSTGPTINLGYEPQWLLIKQASGAGGGWVLLDNMRGLPVGGSDAYLWAELSNAESSTDIVSVSATGFQITTSASNINGNGETIIYIAIRRGPMKTPTDGTSVFQSLIYTGNETARTITGVGFTPDLVIGKPKGDVNPHAFYDRMRGATKSLQSTNTNAEATYSDAVTGFDQMDGIKVGADLTEYSFNWNGKSILNTYFKRAPGFFDVVCYTGTGGGSYNVNHNLGTKPLLVICKSRSVGGTGYNWPAITDTSVSSSSTLFLNTTGSNNGGNSSGMFTDTTVDVGSTAGLASLYGNNQVNASGVTYVMYLFASCPGVSKVGSFTGSTSPVSVDCGFSNGARFVMIKVTSGTGDWFVFDTARGITASGDPYLVLNRTASENDGGSSGDLVDPLSSGFIVNPDIMSDGATYIYLAIA